MTFTLTANAQESTPPLPGLEQLAELQDELSRFRIDVFVLRKLLGSFRGSLKSENPMRRLISRDLTIVELDNYLQPEGPENKTM